METDKHHHCHEDGDCCGGHKDCCGHHHDHSHEGKDAKENTKEYYDKIRSTLEGYDYSETYETAEHEAAHIIEHHFEENNTPEVKKFLLSSLELTSLKVTDNEESILQMVEKVNTFQEAYPELPNVEGICVYPNFISLVYSSLEDDNIHLTSVAGSFPSAQTFSEVKLAEVGLALKDGADDIDIVLPVGKFLSGDYESIADEIGEIKAYVGDGTLKVILETGALAHDDLITRAAILAMYSGADFIKTSTGKLNIGATPAAVYLMRRAIKQYTTKHPEMNIGIKIAGGIHTAKEAVEYYTIIKEVLGADMMTTKTFRIGASSLANALISDITGSETKYF